jgi:hypothetical protein
MQFISQEVSVDKKINPLDLASTKNSSRLGNGCLLFVLATGLLLIAVVGHFLLGSIAIVCGMDLACKSSPGYSIMSGLACCLGFPLLSLASTFWILALLYTVSVKWEQMRKSPTSAGDSTPAGKE